MSPELGYLFLTTLLLTVLWIPHIIGQVTSKGLLSADDYRMLRDNSDLPAWVRCGAATGRMSIWSSNSAPLPGWW